MRSSLLILGRFAHDSQRGLAGIFGRLSGPVGLDDVLRKRLVSGRLGIGRERHLANRTADCALIVDEMRLCHALSLRRPLRRSTPVDFKRHHYLETG